MTLSRIPSGRPDITERERENVANVMESGWLSQGRYVAEAEERLKAITGRRYAICTSSGTTALLASLLSCGFQYNFRDEVIPVPALTFAAVHNVVDILGLVKAFLRSDADTWQVSDERWTRFADHKVLIAAANYGKVQGPILANNGNIVINDIAESFGGTWNGLPAASFGTIACCSFYVNKIVTSVEGGVIVTDDSDLALKLRTVVNHGISAKNYVPTYIGLNGRMTDVHASILCAQLERLPEMLARRLSILKSYYQAAGSNWTFPTIAPGEVPAPWLFAGIPADRDDVIRRCNEANIEWRPFFPIPKEAGPMPETRRISESGICLPLSSALTEEEVCRTCELIHGN